MPQTEDACVVRSIWVKAGTQTIDSCWKQLRKHIGTRNSKVVITVNANGGGMGGRSMMCMGLRPKTRV